MGFVLFFGFLAAPPFVFETPLLTHTHTHQLMQRKPPCATSWTAFNRPWSRKSQKSLRRR